MKRLLILIWFNFISICVFSQINALEACIMTTEFEIEVDGVIDNLWGAHDLDAVPINRMWPNETVSMNNSYPYWKGLWDREYTYILVYVPDDHCYAAKESSVLWLADRVELYFDVNPEKVEDSPMGPSTLGTGHYQIIADFENEYDSIAMAYAIDTLKQCYVYEFKIPHTYFFDKDSNQFQPVEDVTVIGFDITIVDLDMEGMGENIEVGRVNWSNDVAVAGESWNNLDMAGEVEYGDCHRCVSTQNSDKIHLNIYPNPTSGIFHLSSENQVSHIEIFNLQGQKVFETSTFNTLEQIDITNQPQGVYFTKISFKNNQQVLKIVLE